MPPDSNAAPAHANTKSFFIAGLSYKVDFGYKTNKKTRIPQRTQAGQSSGL
jgi:hypothetical protein